MKKILGLVVSLFLAFSVIQAGTGLYPGDDARPISKKQQRALLLAQKEEAKKEAKARAKAIKEAEAQAKLEKKAQEKAACELVKQQKAELKRQQEEAARLEKVIKAEQKKLAAEKKKQEETLKKVEEERAKVIKAEKKKLAAEAKKKQEAIEKAKKEEQKRLAAEKKEQEAPLRKAEKEKAKAIKAERKKREAEEKRKQEELEKAKKEEQKRIDKEKKEAALKKIAQEEAAKKAAKKARKEKERAEEARKEAARKAAEKAKRAEEERIGKWDYLYKVPAWDFCARPYEQTDLANLSSWYRYENESYSSGGHRQDRSKLALGEAPIRLQDILLVSKLLRDDKVVPNGSVLSTDHYLYYLANEVLTFDGETEEFGASLDLARHLFNKDLSIGFQIPFVSRKHELKMRTNLSDAHETAIQANAPEGLPSEYNNDFVKFIEDVLYQKGINYNQRMPKTVNNNIGDISVFANYEIKSRYVERLMVGLKATLPTAPDKNLHKLWDASIGNGGFVEIAPYVNLLYSQNNWFNPHLAVKAGYKLPAKVDRRVPRIRSINGAEVAANTQLSEINDQDIEGMIFTDAVKTKPNGTTSVPWSEPDTTVREFATETARVRMHPGAELNIRVGNMFDGFISKRGTFDIFYDLLLKGKTYGGSNLDPDVWKTEVLTDNTYGVHHKVGINMGYQFDKHFRSQLGGLFTFDGRNVPMLYELNSNWSLDF